MLHFCKNLQEFKCVALIQVNVLLLLMNLNMRNIPHDVGPGYLEILPLYNDPYVPSMQNC